MSTFQKIPLLMAAAILGGAAVAVASQDSAPEQVQAAVVAKADDNRFPGEPENMTTVFSLDSTPKITVKFNAPVKDRNWVAFTETDTLDKVVLYRSSRSDYNDVPVKEWTRVLPGAELTFEDTDLVFGEFYTYKASAFLGANESYKGGWCEVGAAFSPPDPRR